MLKKRKKPHNIYSKKEIQEILDQGLNLKSPFRIIFEKRVENKIKNLQGYFSCEKHGFIEKLKYIGSHIRSKSPTNPCPECKKNNQSKQKRESKDSIQDKSNKLFGEYTYTFLKRDESNPVDGFFRCRYHPNKKQKQNIRSHKKGIRLNCCAKNSFIDKEELQRRSNEIFSEYRYIIIEIKENSKALIKCSKHKNEYPFDKTAFQTHEFGGCNKCSQENNKRKPSMSFIKFKEKALLVHSNYVYNEKINNKFLKNQQENVIITCKDHGDFNNNYLNHVKNQGGHCPDCKSLMSNNEKIIKKYFLDNHITYSYNKEFSNCKRIFNLKFDFYLPEHNLLIEYDGEQHFKHISKFGSIKKFIALQESDQIKNEFAKKRGFNLLRIPALKSKEYLPKIEQTLSDINQGIKIYDDGGI